MTDNKSNPFPAPQIPHDCITAHQKIAEITDFVLNIIHEGPMEQQMLCLTGPSTQKHW